MRLADIESTGAGLPQTRSARPGPWSAWPEQTYGLCFTLQGSRDGDAPETKGPAKAALRVYRRAGCRHECFPFVSCSRSRFALHCVRLVSCAKRVEEREKRFGSVVRRPSAPRQATNQCVPISMLIECTPYILRTQACIQGAPGAVGAVPGAGARHLPTGNTARVHAHQGVPCRLM